MQKATGIIIRRTPLSDTSFIIHWCTREYGMVRTAAKGARRPGSPFAGRLDLFYSADFIWTPARKGDLHALREASVTDYRQGIPKGWNQLLAAAYFTSLIEMVTEPGEPVEGIFLLLQRSLDWLNSRPPTVQGILFFEKELTQELGIHGEAGTAPCDALQRLWQRLPPQRTELMARLV